MDEKDKEDNVVEAKNNGFVFLVFLFLVIGGVYWFSTGYDSVGDCSCVDKVVLHFSEELKDGKQFKMDVDSRELYGSDQCINQCNEKSDATVLQEIDGLEKVSFFYGNGSIKEFPINPADYYFVGDDR